MGQIETHQQLEQRLYAADVTLWTGHASRIHVELAAVLRKNGYHPKQWRLSQLHPDPGPAQFDISFTQEINGRHVRVKIRPGFRGYSYRHDARRWNNKFRVIIVGGRFKEVVHGANGNINSELFIRKFQALVSALKAQEERFQLKKRQEATLEQVLDLLKSTIGEDYEKFIDIDNAASQEDQFSMTIGGLYEGQLTELLEFAKMLLKLRVDKEQTENDQ